MTEEIFRNTGKLGFGLMRLPRTDGAIDIKTTCDMVDRFIMNGFTYFDTAYVYEGSEEAARQALVERFPRDSFTIASKLPLRLNGQEANDPAALTEESLKRLGTDHFDYYLLHGLHNAEAADRANAWEYLRKMRDAGKTRYIGFSWHGSSTCLDRILSDHDEIQFVQLQVNYLDWEDPVVESRNCVNVCAMHGKPVVVMEPVKGGLLASLTDECAAPLAGLGDASHASYALRFAASHPAVKVVLSGMSDTKQMEENIRVMKDFAPLSFAETAAVKQVASIYRDMDLINCTGCRYCAPGCPAAIDIPRLFRRQNVMRLSGDREMLEEKYGSGDDAAKCLGCGTCEAACPQHLPVRQLLKAIRQDGEKTNGHA